MDGLLETIRDDLRRKGSLCYGREDHRSLLKVLASDGTAAMVLYRLMQWSSRRRLAPLAMLFNKWNALFCRCVVGRGAEFGPGFVLVHSDGVFINSKVRGGANVTLYQQVTLGGEGDDVPTLGDGVLIAAGAKVVGRVRLGDGAKVAANSLVLGHVPAHTTVLGVPARPVWSGAAGPRQVAVDMYSGGSS
jgi:serine O-acetyltransferase